MTTSTASLSPELTKRQSEVLEVIRSHIEKTGAPPTRAEIAKQLGFRSVNAAEDHLKALARKGAIVLSPGTSRGIQLSEKHGLGLPILKSISGDKPLLNDANIESRLRIQNEYFSSKPDFLVRMQGISLINAGIKEGDLLAMHTADTAQNGQLVLARIGNKCEIRRYYQRDGQIELKAEHSDFSPMFVNPQTQEFKIEGIAVGIIRTSGL